MKSASKESYLLCYYVFFNTLTDNIFYVIFLMSFLMIIQLKITKTSFSSYYELVYSYEFRLTIYNHFYHIYSFDENDCLVSVHI